MKKFTKIIGIFLCLSMIVGMLSVVGAVDPEPTTPTAPTGAILEGDTLEVVSPTKVDTLFGCYEDFTGEDEDTFMDGADGYCVTDGWFGRAGYSCCTSEDGLIALIMTIDEVTTLGGIEIVCKDEDHAPVKFDIQVMGDVDWETVVSVEENAFTDGLTKTFTFDAVDTDTVRILVYEVATEDECYFNEVTLLKATTGKLKTILDLNGLATGGDAHTGYTNNDMVDGEKATFMTGSTVTVTFPEATAIDGFNLYHYRNSGYPHNVTISIQKTEGGEFETIGTFATGFSNGYPQDSLYATFDQTYMAYGVTIASDVWGYMQEFELWQYQREATEEEPTEEPTEAPTQAPTEAPAAQLSASKLTYKTLPAPTVGYYVGETFTKYENNNGGANMVDYNLFSWGGSQAFNLSELVVNGGTKTPAIVWDLSAAPMTLNGLEILANGKGAHIFTAFDIQVQTTAGGDWETVHTATGALTSTATQNFMFSKDVTAYGMRIMVKEMVGGAAGNILAVQEVTPWIVTEGNAATKVPAASATVGVYNDGATRANLTAATNAADIIDGDKRSEITIGTGNDAWVFDSAYLYGTTGGAITPAAILTLAEATKLTSVEVYHTRDGRVYTPIKVSVEVMVDGVWTNVGSYESMDWNGPAIIAFDEVTTDQVRVLVENITRIDGNTAQWVLPEIELYYTESEEETPVEPTEPATPPTEEPTDAPTQAPTTPAATYTWMDLVAESTITPAVGYFANGDFTTLTDINDGESPLLTNANVGNNTWINGNTFPVPAGKVPGAILDLGTAKTVAGVELVGKAGERITAFDIAVLNTAGEWVDVYTTTDAPYEGSTLKVVFDNAVVGTKIRLVVNDWDSDHPILKELFVYEGLNTDTLVQIPVTNVTASQDPVTGDYPISSAVDGDRFSYYQIGPANMPVAVNFDTTNADGSPTNVSRMRIFAFHSSKYAPQDIVVDVKTATEPETWVNVYTGTAYNLGHTDTFTLDFGATYSAYDVRLTVNSYTAANLILTDVELFGNGAANEPSDPVNPTDPTEEPTEEPTEAPTQAPTEPKADPSKLTYNRLPAPSVGYYVGEAFTRFENTNGGSKMVDDNNETWGGSMAFESGTPTGKTPAIVFDLTNSPMTINGLEIMVNDKTLFTITDFDIEVKTSADGAWENVATATGNPFVNNCTQSFMFDKTVTAYGIRIMINAFNGNNGSNFFFAVQEITPWVVTEGPANIQVPVANAEIGVYMDGNKRAKLSEKKPGDVLIDGDKRYNMTIGDNNNNNPWIFDVSKLNGNGGDYTPAAVLTLAEPTVLTRVEVYHCRDGYLWTPMKVSVQVLDSNGLWQTVGTYEKSGWIGPAIIEFAAVETTQVRVLMETAVRVGNESAQWSIPEIQLFCAEGATVAPPTDPDQPTDPTGPVGSVELPETPVVAPGGDYVIGVPTTGNVFKIVSPTKLTTVFGYYGADGAFVDREDGACVTDGWYGRAGYSECTTADGTIGLIITADEALNIGAIELVGKSADNNPVDFEIQAMVNGEWVTVVDVNEDPFTAGLTKTFTFASVETTQIRILINKVSVETNQCYFNEVSLYEVVNGKQYNKINLNNTITATDAHSSTPGNMLVDGDKATLLVGSNATFNLTVDGKPTAFDGFGMFFYRGNQTFPHTVTVTVQKTEGGEFETVGTFNTNWTSGEPQDSFFAEFGETIVAYGMTIAFDVYCNVNEFELYQYVQEPAPVDPPTDPTEPTEPSVTPTEPTEPSVTPTEPTVTPTEPSQTPTEPSETPTEPTEPGEELDYSKLEEAFALLETLDPEDFTEDSVAAVEAALANILMMDENVTQEELDEAVQALLDAIDALVPVEDEGTDEPGTDLPDVPTLPGAPDLTDIQATIDLIHSLNPSKYTAESYENLIIVVKEVNKILATEGGYSQKMIDRANEMLTEALAALVLVDGGSDVPGGDEDLPAPTGDIALAVISGLMSLSAIGGAVVIGKKKFF